MIRLGNRFSFSFTMMGYALCDESWIHPKATPDSYELIFVTKGRVALRIGNESFDFHAGQLIILPKNVTRSGVEESGCTTEFFWLHFTSENFENLNLDPVHEVKASYRYANLFRELNHLYVLKNTELLESKLLTLLLELESTYNNGNKLCNDVAEWIKLHIRTNLTVQDVAAQFNYSADHLSRLFRNTFNLNLKQYIVQERLILVKSYLTTTNLPLGKISNLCNFSDENTMMKFFIYHEKVSPAEYRKRIFLSHVNGR